MDSGLWIQIILFICLLLFTYLFIFLETSNSQSSSLGLLRLVTGDTTPGKLLFFLKQSNDPFSIPKKYLMVINSIKYLPVLEEFLVLFCYI
jgi:hypothetical protein